MKNISRRNFAGMAAGIVVGASISVNPAFAASAIVEAAKDACVVGEQADGYLGFVPGGDASAELRREVRDINQQRKSYYADIAKRNGVSVEVTATLTAEKLIGQAGPGECVRDQNGQWIEL